AFVINPFSPNSIVILTATKINKITMVMTRAINVIPSLFLICFIIFPPSYTQKIYSKTILYFVQDGFYYRFSFYFFLLFFYKLCRYIYIYIYSVSRLLRFCMFLFLLFCFTYFYCIIHL